MQATSEKSRERFAKRKQLMPRERIALLLDRGSPFLELMPLAGLPHARRQGRVERRRRLGRRHRLCRGRALRRLGHPTAPSRAAPWRPPASARASACSRSCMENKLPLVHLVESGGANLMYQAEIFVPGGRGFANQARMSAARHPAGHRGARLLDRGRRLPPGLSDYVVMVRGQAKVFLAGPPLLKAATGEIATDEELGGAEMHATVSGVAEYLAEDDADGIRMAREIMRHAATGTSAAAAASQGRPGSRSTSRRALRRRPRRLPQALRRARGDRPPRRRLRVPRLQGRSTARRRSAATPSVEGEPSAFIGNNGPITPKGAVKAAQFIQLCCQAGHAASSSCRTPPATWSAREAERAGIVKHGSKMIQAVTNATGAEAHPADRRLLRRRPLRHVRARVRAAPSVRLAERAHRRHGRRAGGEGDAHRRPRRSRARARSRSMGEARQSARRIVDRVRRTNRPRSSPPRACGTTASSTRATPRRMLAFTLSISRESIVRPLNPITFGVARM